MHQQMLARYDTERKAFNLALTQELQDYAQPIAEGYKANLTGFSDRLPNAVMHDIQLGPGQPYAVSQHDQFQKRLLTAAQSGKLQKVGGGTISFDKVEL